MKKCHLLWYLYYVSRIQIILHGVGKISTHKHSFCLYNVQTTDIKEPFSLITNKTPDFFNSRDQLLSCYYLFMSLMGITKETVTKTNRYRSNTAEYLGRLRSNQSVGRSWVRLHQKGTRISSEHHRETMAKIILSFHLLNCDICRLRHCKGKNESFG